MKRGMYSIFAACLVFCISYVPTVRAQTAPSKIEAAGYTGLLAAAYNGDIKQIRLLTVQGNDIHVRDAAGRTPAHVAAFQSHGKVLEALVRAGADINALEGDAYDVITIAAVANDPKILRMALSLGGNPGNVTSRYEGTALIAAAHLGHVEVVKILINAGAPLDHVNNLDWTALIEAIVLGDGGRRHVETAGALIEAGADVTIADRNGIRPIDLARQRGFGAIVALFEKSSR